LVFAFGSAMLMGFLTGLLFPMFPSMMRFTLGLWGLGLANLFGLVGLLLGICGKLPGTRNETPK
jgi:hypothetical protein